MKQALPNLNRMLACIVVIHAAVGILPSKSDAQLTAISPAEFASVEMPDVANLENFPSFRLHQVYSSADFAHLGPGPYDITRVDWRPDGTVTEPMTYSSPNWLMNLSTTTKQPGSLSATFAENIGPDETTVLSGPVTLTTENLGPAGGPKVFDYGVDLDVPFTFDPSMGNLLMDLTVIDAEGPLLLDIVFAPAATTSFYWTGTLGPQSPIATTEEQIGGQFGGHAIQFTVVPEPGTALLLAMAAAGLMLSRRFV